MITATQTHAAKTKVYIARRFHGKGSEVEQLGQYPFMAERDLQRWQRAMRVH